MPRSGGHVNPLELRGIAKIRNSYSPTQSFSTEIGALQSISMIDRIMKAFVGDSTSVDLADQHMAYHLDSSDSGV